MQRLILATTLAASYGIYGPAYELGENLPATPSPGKTESEEYLDSEKYQIRRWDRTAAHTIAPLVTRLNQIRRTNIALQSDLSLHFHEVDNPHIIAYSKSAPASESLPANVILVVVNLDAHNEQGGWLDLDLKQLGIGHNESFDVEDLLTGIHYQWRDRSNYVALRPNVMPAHIFRVSCKATASDMLDISTL
jgi:starch synthase (maltosyl-transferring)